MVAKVSIELIAITRRACVQSVGRRLTACKVQCGHGKWLPWLQREFGWTSESTALRYMQAHEAFGLNPSRVTDLELPMRSLYLLAAPSTPEETPPPIRDAARHGRGANSDVAAWCPVGQTRVANWRIQNASRRCRPSQRRQ